MGVNLDAKASIGWDTSEKKEQVVQGVQSTLLIPTEPIVLTQDNKTCTNGKLQKTGYS